MKRKKDKKIPTEIRRNHGENLLSTVRKKVTCILAMLGLGASVGVFSACNGQDEVQVQQELEMLLENETGSEENLEDSGTEENDALDGSSEVKGIVIHILGAVGQPGVYELPQGSRVADAVKMAGGYTESACVSWLNQARLLIDGEQIYVPTEEEVAQWKESGESDAPVESGGTTNQSEKSSKININQATVEELMNLPGIGESKARSIVDYRQQNGKFSSIEDLMLVPGIKEGVYNQIKDFIKV